MDIFALDGPRLYGTAATDPDLVAALIPEGERRFITEIPIANTGGRQDDEMRDRRGPGQRGRSPAGSRATTYGTSVRMIAHPDRGSVGRGQAMWKSLTLTFTASTSMSK
ncbi:hypothetical protein G5C66_14060 [Nocardioides sp. KC13]|uniref:Uncharacterized protein n=1 Tax=Nocardioides turkmenicus TaxID=2711220 RepID=A0A6M1QVB5_9ACTN|nr:hypothetical protein [Nocardioides sp. KC13]NGN93865.1 hypothetical protein [Nocardioides sp. KC13]